MLTQLEVVLSPAELGPLSRRDLRQATCVVFDILRATSTMITALASGAEAIIPVNEIAEALAIRARRPEVLLAGEREGLRIRAAQPGGIDFDLGNSPREFVREKVEGRTLVMTTTNGTRAFHACSGAAHLLAGSFLNLQATVDWIRGLQPRHLILVCAGTREDPALEDTLAAGAVCEEFRQASARIRVNDSVEIAQRLHAQFRDDLAGAFRLSQNGQRLQAMPELRDDLLHCACRDALPLVAVMRPDGLIRRII